jgi:DNA anti-recombination protein RmuC
VVELTKKIGKFEDDLKEHQNRLSTMKKHIDGMGTELKKLKPKTKK